MVAQTMYGTGSLPEDFSQRIQALRSAAGVSQMRLAEIAGTDARQVRRWLAGTPPSGWALYALIRFAAHVPGGLDLLMGTGFLRTAARSQE